jgi:MFS family permease
VGPLYITSIAPFLVENSEASERGLLFTFDASLMNLSTFVATTAGGYLPRLFATLLQVGEESALAYRGAMLVAAAATALGLLPVLTLRDGPRRAPAHPSARPSWRFWRRFSDPRLLLRLTGPRVVLAFAAGLVFPFLNLFYKEKFGVSDVTLGWVFGITELFAGMMMLASDGAVRRWGKISTTLVTRAISTPMLLIIAFVPSFPVAVAAHWMRSGLMRLGGPLYMAFAMELLDESERATGSSLLGMSWDVGWSLGPAVSGLAQPVVGYEPLFVSTVVLYGVSLALTYRYFGGGRGDAVKPLPATRHPP